MPTVPFPAVLDSTIIAAFRSCPQKAFRTYLQHYKPKQTSIHLRAGAAYAAGLEAARLAFFAEGSNEEDAKAAGLQKLIETYGDFECPADSAKSLERMCGALEYYLDCWPLSTDKAVPIALPSGKRGVEFSFTEPIDFPHPETGDPLLYVGRMDTVVDFAGAVYGEDDKTTSQLGAKWGDQWNLRSQFTGYCLLGSTEVLTPNGWVEIQNLPHGIPVAQWGNGQVQFVLPEKYHAPQYSGLMTQVSGKVEFTCTPDHRTLVYDSYTDSYKTFLMKDLPKNSGALRYVSAGWKADGETFEPAAVKLLVAIQADGSFVYGKQGNLLHVRFTFAKRRKFERLMELVEELQLPWTQWKSTSGLFSGKIDATNLIENIEALLGKDKRWGAWLLRLSGETLRGIMDELCFWDGTIEDTLYSTSSEENADWIRTIAALCGMRASIHTQAARKTQKLQYRVSYHETHRHSVHLHTHKEVPFEGTVYCLTVPSSYFLIRVNGQISVTGNCWGAKRAGIPLAGFLIRGVSILKTKYDHAEAITYRPQWMIDRWYEQLLRDVKRMKDMWEAGGWDYNLDHACAEYGGCDLRQVCLSADPEPWLKINFERRVWDPVLREERILEEN
jgi:hypothetical protein